MTTRLSSLFGHALTAVGLAVALLGTAHAQGFVPEDVEICPPSAQIRDPEFNIRDRTMAFTDAEFRLKVAPIRANATLGRFGCAGRVVDTNVNLSIANTTFRNGAEWARSQKGPELFYAKTNPDGRLQLARAWPNGSGAWLTELLAGGEDRQLPVASMDAADPQARIFYWQLNADQTTTTLWREADQPETEQAFPGFVGPGTGGAPRWIPGLRAISTVAPDAQGVLQAAIYFVDTGETRLLTSDAVDKDEVWLWQAPEFGNDWAMIAVVDGCCLRVYRQQAGDWLLVNTINAPDLSSTTGRMYSPEPVVYKGRSYVAMQLSGGLRFSPSDIWVVAVDPARPLARQVSAPSTTPRIRNEPEWYHDRSGIYVFYSEVSVAGFALRRARAGF